jgi:hypothetical protein
MRSGTQDCPICGGSGPLVEHHIHGRKTRGWSQAWNIIWVCGACHDKIHIKPPLIIIEGWVSTTSGRELIWRRPEDDPVISDGANPPTY